MAHTRLAGRLGAALARSRGARRHRPAPRAGRGHGATDQRCPTVEPGDRDDPRGGAPADPARPARRPRAVTHGCRAGVAHRDQAARAERHRSDDDGAAEQARRRGADLGRRGQADRARPPADRPRRPGSRRRPLGVRPRARRRARRRARPARRRAGAPCRRRGGHVPDRDGGLDERRAPCRGDLVPAAAGGQRSRRHRRHRRRCGDRHQPTRRRRARRDARAGDRARRHARRRRRRTARHAGARRPSTGVG